jgi:protein phosphatase
MKLYYSYLSDVGNVRTINEDCLFVGKIGGDAYLFVVADGMGGHDAGEVASYKAVSMFVKRIKRGVEGNIPEVLRQIVLSINEILIHEGKKAANYKGMGTTLTALYIKDDKGYIAHVGDSRVYRYADGSLEQLTEDHSLVGKLLKGGFITKKEAQSHPKRNVLYQSVGLKPGIEVECIGPIPIQMGQKFLLCSDGLSNEVGETEIEESLKVKSTKRMVDELIKLAKTRTASDNITVIAISTEKDETAELEDTVKIATPVRVLKNKKKKIGFFILLGLLILLLIALLYILIQNFQKESTEGKKGDTLTTSYNQTLITNLERRAKWKGKF